MEQREFLVTFLVNIIRVRSNVPDQTRWRVVVRASDEAEARKRVQPIADGLGATFDLEPIEVLDDVQGLPLSIRRYCKSHGYQLVVSATQSDPVPNCS